jgi:hypothetical protein
MTFLSAALLRVHGPSTSKPELISAQMMRTDGVRMQTSAQGIVQTLVTAETLDLGQMHRFSGAQMAQVQCESLLRNYTHQ